MNSKFWKVYIRLFAVLFFITYNGTLLYAGIYKLGFDVFLNPLLILAYLCAIGLSTGGLALAFDLTKRL